MCPKLANDYVRRGVPCQAANGCSRKGEMQKQVNEGGGVGVVSEWRPGYWWPAQGSSLSPPAPFPERTSRAWILEPSKDRKFSGQWPYDNGPFLLFSRKLLSCGKNARMKLNVSPRCARKYSAPWLPG